MAVRVFLVEDRASMRSWMGDALATAGHVLAGVAVSEAQALSWLDEHPGAWDVAIVDLVLEEGSGFAVLRHARDANESSTIVVFSSYVSGSVAEHCLAFGADLVFDKHDKERFAAWLRDGVRG